jgi:serine/threonine protein kinase/TolB-like protein/Tfp pilus assembly protein PilF
MHRGSNGYPAQALEEPRKLKHYEILSRIGEGGMGVVYRARDTRLGRTVALKVLHQELAGDEERSKRFEREARIVSSMSHPGIATVYDFDRDGQTAFFAMELVEGSTLRELLKRGPMPIDQAIDCAVQVSEALVAAHREGVVHRDLKPENVIAASSGYYKVLDFGVARMEPAPSRGQSGTQLETLSWATSAGGLLGTVGYMSPEQALAESLDARSDIFSFGSMMYELTTGRPAFRGNNAIATANAIVHEQHVPMRSHRPEVPVGLQLIIDKCLAKEPAERYQSAEDLVNDLRTLQLESLSGSRSYRQLLAHRDAPSRRKRRLAAMTIGSVVVLAAVAVAVVFFSRREPTRPMPLGPEAPPAFRARPAVALEERPRVIVAFFENHTNDPSADWLGRGLPEMLTTDLSRTGELEVIATQRLYDLAAAAGQGGDSPLDASTVAELARWANANIVISGSVFKLGEIFRIDAQAYDTRTGTVSVAHKVEGTDLFQMVNELTAGLRQGLQLGAGAKGGLQLAATSSEEAFRFYTQARQHYDNLSFDLAAERLERSLETDPDFALAKLRLALSHYALGDHEAAAEQIEGLAAQAGRLPEGDRLLAQALNAFLIEEDFDAGAAHLEELLRKYPNNGAAWVLWARGLDDLADDPLAATHKLRQAIEQDPNNLSAIVAMADHLARFGAIADAEIILSEAAERHPEAAAELEQLIDTIGEPDPQP